MKTIKDILVSVLVIVIAVAVVATGLILADLFKVKNEALGFPSGSNVLDSMTHYTTSTGSYDAAVPVKILTRNNERLYALIQNNSDTNIYLYFPTGLLAYNFSELATGYTSATSSITTLEGLVKIVPSGSYEILPENMWIGEIWATSTAVSKNINIVYR